MAPNVIKRVLLGRALRSTQLHEQLLSKRIALPVFASDPLSSVAYAPEQIFLTLSVAGLSAYDYAPWLALVIALVLMTVVASYRQNVRAYTSGGGDFEVATTNLGGNAGLTVASALLVDYVLTVAVSVSSGVDNVASAFPTLAPHKVILSILVVSLLTVVNLRGVRESGTAFAIPTYAFIVGILGMVAIGVVRALVGSSMEAPSAHFQIRAEHGHLAGLALAFLLLRAYSSGSAALTGVEAMQRRARLPSTEGQERRHHSAHDGSHRGHDVRRHRVPRECHPSADGREPRESHRRAARLHPADGHRPDLACGVQRLLARLLLRGHRDGSHPHSRRQHRIQRLSRARLHPRPTPLSCPGRCTTAATSSCSATASSYSARYDRSSSSGSTPTSTSLIHLYIIGVFTSFTLSQAGMVRRWNRLIRTESVHGPPPHATLTRDEPQRSRHRRRPSHRDLHEGRSRGLDRIVAMIMIFAMMKGIAGTTVR